MNSPTLTRNQFQALPGSPSRNDNGVPFNNPNFNYHPQLMRSFRDTNSQQQQVLLCYKCNRPGHIARNCFQASQEKARGIECFYCRKIGHRSSECRKKLYDETRQKGEPRQQQINSMQGNQ